MSVSMQLIISDIHHYFLPDPCLPSQPEGSTVFKPAANYIIKQVRGNSGNSVTSV